MLFGEMFVRAGELLFDQLLRSELVVVHQKMSEFGFGSGRGKCLGVSEGLCAAVRA